MLNLDLQALESGSVADWVAGVGTLLAVIVALWIAGTQQREQARARQRAEVEQRARTLLLIDEALKLAQQISLDCQDILNIQANEQTGARPDHTREQAALEFVNLTARGYVRLHDMSGLREQIIALKDFDIEDARAYIEISRMAYEADIGYVRNIDHRKVPRSELLRVIDDMKLRSDRLREIAAEL